MIELFFAAGIPFAVYLIFTYISTLKEYADIVFWVFIACLILFGITAIIKAIFVIKDTVPTGKTNVRKKK